MRVTTVANLSTGKPTHRYANSGCFYVTVSPHGAFAGLYGMLRERSFLATEVRGKPTF